MGARPDQVPKSAQILNAGRQAHFRRSPSQRTKIRLSIGTVAWGMAGASTSLWERRRHHGQGVLESPHHRRKRSRAGRLREHTALARERNLPVHHERNGALVVDRCLRLADYPNVYAIGDNAWAKDETTGAAVPALAQAAEYEAKYVAASIASSLSGRSLRPFRFNKLGQMTLLGRRDGIVEIGPLTVTGFPAWLMWHGYYLSHIGSWRNRVLLAADWFLSLLVGRETSELALERNPSCATRRSTLRRADRRR